MSRSEAIRRAILDAAAALQRKETLQAEVAVLDADEQNRQETLKLASLMDGLHALG
jgi:hypothetical protein